MACGCVDGSDGVHGGGFDGFDGGFDGFDGVDGLDGAPMAPELKSEREEVQMVWLRTGCIPLSVSSPSICFCADTFLIQCF